MVWCCFGFALVTSRTPVKAGVVSAASAQIAPTVTSKVVQVANHNYTVYSYDDPATKKFCVVIPEGPQTVRSILVNCNYAGGDSRSDWTFCHYYREFMHLHDFALVASAGDIPRFARPGRRQQAASRLQLASPDKRSITVPPAGDACTSNFSLPVRSLPSHSSPFATGFSGCACTLTFAPG